jgi:hypothetical protein
MAKYTKHMRRFINPTTHIYATTTA